MLIDCAVLRRFFLAKMLCISLKVFLSMLSSQITHINTMLFIIIPKECRNKKHCNLNTESNGNLQLYIPWLELASTK